MPQQNLMQWLPILALGGGAYYLYTTGDLQKIVDGISGILAKAGEGFSKTISGLGGDVPSTGGSSSGTGTGTGGGTTGGTVTGTMIYKGTGKVMNAKDEGEGTRNYASGKPSDKTHEWNVENCPFTAYEFTGFVTINKIDHDDTISMKLYGPHHQDGKGSWYVLDVTFNSGSVTGGWEHPHPDGDYECLKGGSMGKIVGKKIGLKSVIWPLSGGGAHCELYGDASGSGNSWTQLFAGDNPCGKKWTKDPNQQVQLRIDAAPGCKAENVTVAEILSPGQKVAAVAHAYHTPAPYTPNYSRIIMGEKVPLVVATIDGRNRLVMSRKAYVKYD